MSGRDRFRLAAEAARLLANGQARTPEQAEREAARRLGLDPHAAGLSSADIDAALVEQRRLFSGRAFHARLRAAREAALEAMLLLERFEPRLTGGLLSGTDDQAPIVLHVVADRPEDLSLFLLDHHIPHRSIAVRLRFGRNERAELPGIGFLAGEHEVQLVVFTPERRRSRPYDAARGRPMERASIAALRQLLARA